MGAAGADNASRTSTANVRVTITKITLPVRVTISLRGE